jgi:sarcosine/dimethylglycine N-methyltransferase
VRHQGTTPFGAGSRFEPARVAPSVVDFYDRHPINEAQVMLALRRRGLSPGAPLAPEDLFELDQDHYGGPAAVETLARRAGVTATSRVLDVCAGLAGPARVLAHRRGCRVVACELNQGRAAGGARLTRLVGLARRITLVRADARVLPFAAASFDACLSQEGLLHIDDKAAVLAECQRVLVPGGRLAFTDWIAQPRLGDRERAQLWRWMAATTLQSLDGYRALLGRAGFRGVEAEDVSAEWRVIVRARHARFRAMRRDTIATLGAARYAEYDQLFTFFAGLIEDGKLGGGRLTASGGSIGPASLP